MEIMKITIFCSGVSSSVRRSGLKAQHSHMILKDKNALLFLVQKGCIEVELIKLTSEGKMARQEVTRH